MGVESALSVAIRFPRSLILIKKDKQKENENELGQGIPWDHIALHPSPFTPGTSYLALYHKTATAKKNQPLRGLN